MHYSRISADILYPDHAPDIAEALNSFAASKDMAATLDALFSPPHAGYKALKAKLAEARGQTPPGAEPKVVRIPEGKSLRPGRQGFARAVAARTPEHH